MGNWTRGEGGRAGGPGAWTRSRRGSRWWAGSEAGRVGCRCSGRDTETKQAGFWSGTQGGRTYARASKGQPRLESQKAGLQKQDQIASKDCQKAKDRTAPKEPPRLVVQLLFTLLKVHLLTGDHWPSSISHCSPLVETFCHLTAECLCTASVVFS